MGGGGFLLGWVGAEGGGGVLTANLAFTINVMTDVGASLNSVYLEVIV